jgi:dolichyl-phosphate-mannose--protein O-mannosyl transferase
MLKSFDRRYKLGLALGVICGVIGFFILDHLIFSIALGAFAAGLVADQEDWIAGARFTSLVGAILAVIFVVFSLFSSLDDLADISFTLLDHTLYLLFLGGLGCVLVGAVVGALTTSIRSLIP